MKISPQKSESRKGFALVVSITLMSFLLLLVMALVTLTSLETQSAANTRHSVEAQQNALVALNIALGELQKYAGPDQRVTARGDLQHGANAPGALWTGVYGNSIAADYDATPEQIATDLTDPTKVDSQGSPAQLLSWLVSGNENIPFNPADDVGDSGEITKTPAADDIDFKPNATVSNLTNASPTSTDITILSTAGNSVPARLLVGPGSTSNNNGYVAAPLVDLEGSASGIKGRYAWWVGDEGVKARGNLPLVTEDDDKLNAFVNATRTAVELMSDGTDDEALDGPRIDTTYNPLAVSNTNTLNDLPLSSSNPDDFDSKLKHRFHDVTTHSQSLLTDTYAGGFKRDLSILLDEDYTVANDDPTADTNRMWTLDPKDTGYTGTGSGWNSPPGYLIPTWGHLRSYAQTRVPTEGDDAMKMSPILPAHDKEDDGELVFEDHVGLAPVITYFSMGFSMQPAAEPAEGVQLNMQLYPLVVIWNPYNFTIQAPPVATDGNGGNYEVGFYPAEGMRLQLQVDDPTRQDPDPEKNWRRIALFDFQRNMDGNFNNFEYIRFRLNCPDIPPGQSLVFSLPPSASGSSAERYTQYNLLENIEPEPGSFVVVPFTYTSEDAKNGIQAPPGVAVNDPITIAPGEVNVSYRLKSHGAAGYSLVNNGYGEPYIYLGEPVTNRVSHQSSNQHIGHNPSYRPRRWYNAHQRAAWQGIYVENGSVQQLTNQLEYFPNDSEPDFVFLMQALFSGHGNNGDLYGNLHMFSTRWLAQGNMRAPRTGRTRRDPEYNPLFFSTAGSPDSDTEWQRFHNGKGTNSNRTSAGQGHDWIGGSPVDTILFEFPYEDQPLFSIGQLQHANLSLIGSYPSYPIGNSLADFRLPADGTIGGELVRTNRAEGTKNKDLTYEQKAYYDISYLLNRTLWDRYYFSTIPTTGSIPDTLPNLRYSKNSNFADEDLRDPNKNAVGLMLKGGFNINSTSEQAWRAVLGGTNQLEYNPETSSSSGTMLEVAFPRFTKPTSGDDPNEAWGGGYRTLNEDQVAQLARNIVTEIKNRGPFVSLADFVNRRFVDNPETNDSIEADANTSYEHEHYSGTLQAAINRTNNDFPANDGSDTFWDADLVADLFTKSQFGSNQYERGMVLGADATGRPYSNRSSFAPNYLTQGDILSTIGASLTASSDTFVIRAYGEVVNPLNLNEVNAQAWCEAVVQRLPDFIDDSNPAHTPMDDTEANSLGMASLTDLNKQLGRKFEIIDFRWLSADEI